MSELEKLSARFRRLPSAVAKEIALRDALRVAPLLATRPRADAEPFSYWDKPRRPERCLSIFRCYQISIFSNILPEIDGAASRAADDAAAAAQAVYTSRTFLDDFTSTACKVAAMAIEASVAATKAFHTDVPKRTCEISNVAKIGAIAKALEVDIDVARQGFPLLSQPLWLEGMPDRITSLWDTAQKDLLSLESNFEIWIQWYTDKIIGRPPNLELERQWALVPHDVLSTSAVEINLYLKNLRDASRSRDVENISFDESIQALPGQEPGLQFAVDQNGRIDLKPSGLAPPNDIAEILKMRQAIVEALNDLAELLNGTNAYASIATVAKRYKSAISCEELSIDLLYAYGLRLENAQTRLQREIASGDCPDFAVPAGEALDSIVALHGPVIYSTVRGRELLDRARSYRENQADLAPYKAKAQAVAIAIDKSPEAISETAREILVQVSADIGEGPRYERSTEIARTGLANFMIAAAKATFAGIQQGFSADEIQNSAKDGVKDAHKTIVKWAYIGVAPAATVGIYAASPALCAFFLANMSLLRDFAAAAGGELSWLPHFLHWLERQQLRRQR
jgi:hypothetical protein